MKIAVLGGGGRMGQQIITQALARGHSVTTLVRNISKISIAHPQLSIIQGDATQHNDMQKIISDCDILIHAVSVPLRHQKPTHLYSAVTQTVIDARPTESAPQHYIVMSSTGTDHGRKLPWPASWGYELLLGDVADDKEKEEELLASSSLPWTVIKAVILTNGSSSTYHTVLFSEYHPGWQTVPRTAVANAICDSMGEVSNFGKKIVVTR